MAELAAQIEHLLGRGEVGEEDAVQGAAGYVVGRTQQPDDPGRDASPIHLDGQCVAQGDAVGRGGVG